MRLIDADKLLLEERLHLYYHLQNGDIAIPIIDIKNAPTVDAVEVIRCENCQKRDDKWEDWEEGKVLYWCDIMDGCVKADDYCSYAERRVGKQMTKFEKQIHDMFDHIWDCKIDHQVFQDTVGDLMSAVIQAHYNSAQQIGLVHIDDIADMR